MKQRNMPNRCLTSTSFLQEAAIKGDIIINVKDDFFVEPFLGGPHRSKLPRDVRHVDTTGRPQFSVTEERVCEINESRRVYHKFLKEKMDNVPIAFRDDAKKLLDSYQREIMRVRVGGRSARARGPPGSLRGPRATRRGRRSRRTRRARPRGRRPGRG
jgi:hypothetical protein